MKIIKFIIVGIFFSFPGEILNQIYSHGSVSGFWSTLRSYAILLVLAYFYNRFLNRRVVNRAKRHRIYYLTFALLGLAVEWFLLGNGPWNFDLLQPFTQLAMLTYWGTFLFLPVLVVEKSDPATVRKFIGAFIIAASLWLIIGRNNTGLGFIIFIIFYDLANIYLFRYFRSLRLKETAV